MNYPDMSEANWIRMPRGADKDDIAALSKRIKRIEDLLVELITLVAKIDAETHGTDHDHPANV